MGSEKLARTPELQLAMCTALQRHAVRLSSSLLLSACLRRGTMATTALPFPRLQDDVPLLPQSLLY